MTAFLLELPFDIAGTDLYYIDHFIFGVGFPFLVYSLSGKFSWGIFAAFIWSIGNEFCEDQFTRLEFKVDWDHFFGDVVGIFVSWIIFKIFWKPNLPNKALG